MGRPVIAANHGGARETVVDGETGWLVAPGDAQAWAAALARAIDLGPGRREAMGQSRHEPRPPALFGARPCARRPWPPTNRSCSAG